MKKQLISMILAIALTGILSSQTTGFDYFGQQPPGKKPEIFAPGFIVSNTV